MKHTRVSNWFPTGVFGYNFFFPFLLFKVNFPLKKKLGQEGSFNEPFIGDTVGLQRTPCSLSDSSQLGASCCQGTSCSGKSQSTENLAEVYESFVQLFTCMVAHCLHKHLPKSWIDWHKEKGQMAVTYCVANWWQICDSGQDHPPSMAGALNQAVHRPGSKSHSRPHFCLLQIRFN